MAEKTGNHHLLHESRIGRKAPGVLVLRAGAIGDTLMVTPLVRALRRTFPDAYLGFICSRTAHDVLRYNPHLDQVIPLTHRHLPVWLNKEKRRIVRHLNAAQLDAVLSLESHSDFTTLACRMGAARVITYDPSQLAKNVEHVAPDLDEHSVETHLRAGAKLGVRPAGLNLEFCYPSQLDEALSERLMKEDGVRDTDLVVGIHAGWGSRKQHPTETRLRSWPAERFARIIGSVAQLGGRVILTGSVIDRPLTEFIAQSVNVPLINLAGRLSLLELAALIRRMDLYVTVDSGPAHIAAALGTPLITLWGPGIIKATAPLAGAGPVRILYSPPACAPCYGTPLLNSCQDNVCMKQIGITEVMTTAKQMLAPRLSRLQEQATATGALELSI